MRSSTRRISEDCHFTGLNTIKGNNLRDGERLKIISLAFRLQGKITHMGRLRTSDLGLRQRGKAHVKSGFPHAELQLLLSHRHSLLCKGSIGRGASTCIPVYLAAYHARIPSGWSSSRVAWKQDPKQDQQICSLPTAVYNSQQWAAEQAAWESHHLSLWEKPCQYWGHCTAQGNQEPTTRQSASKSISKAWTTLSDLLLE